MEEVKPYNLCKCRECTGTGLGWIKHLSPKEEGQKRRRMRKQMYSYGILPSDFIKQE
jgi:hypothetical protein